MGTTTNCLRILGRWILEVSHCTRFLLCSRTCLLLLSAGGCISPRSAATLLQGVPCCPTRSLLEPGPCRQSCAQATPRRARHLTEEPRSCGDSRRPASSWCYASIQASPKQKTGTPSLPQDSQQEQTHSVLLPAHLPLGGDPWGPPKHKSWVIPQLHPHSTGTFTVSLPVSPRVCACSFQHPVSSWDSHPPGREAGCASAESLSLPGEGEQPVLFRVFVSGTLPRH